MHGAALRRLSRDRHERRRAAGGGGAAAAVPLPSVSSRAISSPATTVLPPIFRDAAHLHEAIEHEHALLEDVHREHAVARARAVGGAARFRSASRRRGTSLNRSVASVDGATRRGLAVGLWAGAHAGFRLAKQLRPTVLRTLPPREQSCVLTFVLANRKEGLPVGTYGQNVLVQAASVYNCYVQIR